MTNQDDLKFLYRKISVLEMTEKLKSCGVLWNQVGPVTYRAEISQDDHVWEMNLTRDTNGRVVMDFRRDAVYFYSISSDDDSYLVELFNAIEGDEAFEKDQELLRDISDMEGCREN